MVMLFFCFFEDNNELYDAVVCCAFFAALQTDTNGRTMVPYADRAAVAFFCLYQPAFKPKNQKQNLR